jgi:hypothetical protein
MQCKEERKKERLTKKKKWVCFFFFKFFLKINLKEFYFVCSQIGYHSHKYVEKKSDNRH